MLPCGNSLVKPHISGGNMDGQIIHQIFCRKTIYLQPSKQLLEEDDTCTVEKETLDLPDLHPPKKRQDTCSKEQKTMDLPDLHPPKKRQDTCSKEQKTMDLPDLHPPKKHLKPNYEGTESMSFKDSRPNISDRTDACNITQLDDLYMKMVGAMDEDEALETAIQESVDEYTITSKSEERESAYGRYEQVQGRTPEEVRGIVSAWADSKISGVDRRLIVSRNTVFKSSLMYFKRDAFVKKASLLKVENATCDNEVREAVDKNRWWEEIDGIMSRVTMDNKEEFIGVAASYLTTLRCSSMITDLKKGLETYDVLKLVIKENLRDLFEYKKVRINSSDLLALLKPRFSHDPRKKEHEELVLVNFHHFVESIQDNELETVLKEGDVILTTTMNEFIRELEPKHILVFATGSSRIPTTGFHPKPAVTFHHDNTQYFPCAVTCSNELQLFVNAANTNLYVFASNFLVGLMNGGTFSKC